MVNVCTPGWVVIPPLADSESRSSLVATRNINNKDVPLAIGVYTETMFLNRGKWVGGGGEVVLRLFIVCPVSMFTLCG